MRGREIELDVCNTGHDEVGAYERLIGEALEGDPSLFAREDGVLEAWRIVDPLLRRAPAPQAVRAGLGGPCGGRCAGRRVGRLAPGARGIGDCRSA